MMLYLTHKFLTGLVYLIFSVFKILLTWAPKFYGTKFHIHTTHEAKFRKQTILKPAINLSYGINLTAINVVQYKKKLNSVALVRTRTIPTEQPPPVGEVSANFCG